MKSIAYDKAYRFSVRIVNFCSKLKRSKTDLYLTEHLLTCGTTVGASLAQAYGATTKVDFSDRVATAYRGCQEASFWLTLIGDTSKIDTDEYKKLLEDTAELGKFLFAMLHSSENKF